MGYKTKAILASGGLIVSLAVGGGIAAAAPEDAIIYSTCSYPQVMAAVNAQAPDAAQVLNENPMASAWLQSLVAAGPDQRRRMVQQAQRIPQVQAYTGVIAQVANTCSNY